MTSVWRDRVRGGSATRKKTTVARPNEDAVMCRAANGMMAVFDGIGAYTYARLASKVAREQCIPLLQKIDSAHYTRPQDAMMALGKALLAAQDGVLDLLRQFPDGGDGGTTATMLKLWQATPTEPVMALYANIGDSRLYYWNHAHQTLMRLTEDDNVLRQWVQMGWVEEQDGERFTDLIDGFTGTEPLPSIAYEAWEQRNTICAWLGMPDITYSLSAIPLEPHDRLIAMSDGIHDNLTTQQISQIVARPLEPRTIAVNLIDVAQSIAALDESPRAKPDDMAVAVFEFLQ